MSMLLQFEIFRHGARLGVVEATSAGEAKTLAYDLHGWRATSAVALPASVKAAGQGGEEAGVCLGGQAASDAVKPLGEARRKPLKFKS